MLPVRRFHHGCSLPTATTGARSGLPACYGFFATTGSHLTCLAAFMNHSRVRRTDTTPGCSYAVPPHRPRLLTLCHPTLLLLPADYAMLGGLPIRIRTVMTLPYISSAYSNLNGEAVRRNKADGGSHVWAYRRQTLLPVINDRRYSTYAARRSQRRRRKHAPSRLFRQPLSPYASAWRQWRIISREDGGHRMGRHLLRCWRAWTIRQRGEGADTMAQAQQTSYNGRL